MKRETNLTLVRITSVSVVLLNPQPGDRIALDAFAQVNSSLSAVVSTADVIVCMII